MDFGFHPAYLIVLLAIALIFFGPGKLPQLGGAVGKMMREFRSATDGIQDQMKQAFEEPATPEATVEYEPVATEEPASTVSEPDASGAPETEPIVAETEPIVAETEPIAPETEPIAAGTEPIVAEAAPGEHEASASVEAYPVAGDGTVAAAIAGEEPEPVAAGLHRNPPVASSEPEAPAAESQESAPEGPHRP
jgi:TatA/E family protein of Tat protein translocase